MFATGTSQVGHHAAAFHRWGRCRRRGWRRWRQAHEGSPVVHGFEEPLRVEDVLLEPCYPERVAREPRRARSGQARCAAGAIFGASYRLTAADPRNAVEDLIRRRVSARGTGLRAHTRAPSPPSPLSPKSAHTLLRSSLYTEGENKLVRVEPTRRGCPKKW